MSFEPPKLRHELKGEWRSENSSIGYGTVLYSAPEKSKKGKCMLSRLWTISAIGTVSLYISRWFNPNFEWSFFKPPQNGALQKLFAKAHSLKLNLNSNGSPPRKRSGGSLPKVWSYSPNTESYMKTWSLVKIPVKSKSADEFSTREILFQRLSTHLPLPEENLLWIEWNGRRGRKAAWEEDGERTRIVLDRVRIS